MVEPAPKTTLRTQQEHYQELITQNDIASQQKIGVIQYVTSSYAYVSWGDVTTVSDNALTLGNNYYLSTTASTQRLVVDKCNLCRPNRYCGFAYNSNKVFIKIFLIRFN